MGSLAAVPGWGEARQGIGEFIERYSQVRLLERHGYRTPAGGRTSLTRQAA